MKKSISASVKRRGRPVTTGTGMTIGVRMLDDRITVLDAWIKKQRDAENLSRPEAIRRLVELGLTVKPKSATTGRLRAARASDLAAKVIDTLTPGGTDVEEKASRKRRLLKGPEEFREVRVDRAKNK
jgi:hypothetical protein